MLAYKTLGYRPPTMLPIEPPRLGQVTLGQERAVALGAGALSVAVSSATAWVGISTGLREKGLLSVAGWIVGIAGGLRGLLEVVGIALIATGSAQPQSTTTQTISPAA